MLLRKTTPLTVIVGITVLAIHPNSPTAQFSESSDHEGSLVDLAPSSVREDFAAGIVALHDFWHEEAEERFRAVQRKAPDFALGYWGEALALHRDPFGFREPPVDSMRAILARLGSTPTERAERAGSDHARMYLRALERLIAPEGTAADRHPAYVRLMGELANTYPEDIEALAFHARAQLLGAESFSHSREVQALTAEAARRVLDRNPDHHGGLHYYIHGMDAPDTGPDARAEADRYQRLATGASHAVHMPSHIYMQLGMWDRVVEGNRAAVRTSEEWITATGRSLQNLDRHAVDFLVYGLLQQGREAEVRELLDRTRRERAEFNSGGLRWYDALWSARYAMEVGERSTIPLPRSGYASVGESLGLGLHRLTLGDTTGAREYLEEMATQVREDAGVEWQIAALELEAAIGGGAGAVSLLEQAIALQSSLPRPNETPDLVKPPEELLGEVLLANGRPEAARAAFEAGGRRWPGRLATRLGLARSAVALGDRPRARAAYQCISDQLALAGVEHPARLEAAAYLGSTRSEIENGTC